MKTGGIGASLSAVVHESLFNELDHEVRGSGRGRRAGVLRGAGDAGVARGCKRAREMRWCRAGGSRGWTGSYAPSPPRPAHQSACQVVRLSSQDVPTSYAYELEAATIVQPEQVAAAVRQVCGARVAA